MAKASILVEREPPVTTVVIDRPEVRNALDRAASAELTRALLAFEADPEARVAVLTGAGGAFCAGADLRELAQGELYEPWAASADGPTARTLGKPVIAAIEGAACAGGLGIALWCDLRVVDETAVFGVFSRRFGVPMSDGTTVRLPRLIGLSRALDLLLTGRAVGAEEAIAIGLANRLAPRGRSARHGGGSGARDRGPPAGSAALRSPFRHEQLDLPLAEALRREAEGSRVARERDAAGGAARFVAGEGRHGRSIAGGGGPVSPPGTAGERGRANRARSRCCEDSFFFRSCCWPSSSDSGASSLASQAPPATRPKRADETPELVLEPAELSDLEGWNDDSLDGFARGAGADLRQIATRDDADQGVAGSPADWKRVCERAAAATGPAALRQVLAEELRPWAMRDRDRDQGLLTGYYEPLLHGSLRRTERYTVPLYLRPPELVDIDLGAFRDDLRGRRLAGVVRGGRLVPFADRAGVEQGALAGRDLELLWVDDPIDAFFLHIQGSGRVELADGTQLRVGYAAQNGHPYVAIGRELVARGALALEDVTMQSIRAWLESTPARPPRSCARIRRSSSSASSTKAGPVGSAGAVLEPYRSIAVDTAFLPKGVPVWIEGAWPSPSAEQPDRPLRRLVVAQDTGGAIRGPLRADLFCGHGEEAAAVAGRLKHPVKMWLLLPRGSS